jgi:hypothetical protein
MAMDKLLHELQDSNLLSVVAGGLAMVDVCMHTANFGILIEDIMYYLNMVRSRAAF